MNFINILFLFVGGLSPTSNESRNGCVFGHWIVQNKGHEGNEKQIKFNKKNNTKQGCCPIRMNQTQTTLPLSRSSLVYSLSLEFFLLLFLFCLFMIVKIFKILHIFVTFYSLNLIPFIPFNPFYCILSPTCLL